uniref:Gamma-soluble NSF attachment protein n=1 Tax=Spirometra erinaceieuropaei TaxID=99802 RepID=A0A0F6MV68_SPIER|nr:gamma-soluble nsf attachment protein [Spirometra erinaceieuropaei]
MSGKLAEAEEFIKKAEKSLKTSLLKWKPDLDSAIEYYGKAAIIYQNLKMRKESAELYCLIAKLNADNGSFFHCAKAYDTASLLYREIPDFPKMIECVETAGKMLRQNGVPDSATGIYKKAAKALESQMSEKSAEFYENAAGTAELEGKALEGADLASQAARIWTSLHRFTEAERLLRYEMKLCECAANDDAETAYRVCGKAVLALLVIKLFQGDSIAASKVYDEAVQRYRFGQTDDAGPAASLLQVFDSMDAAGAANVVKLPTFRAMETEYSRLLRTIKFPSADSFGESKAPNLSAKENPEEGGGDEAENQDIC